MERTESALFCLKPIILSISVNIVLWLQEIRWPSMGMLRGNKGGQ